MIAFEKEYRKLGKTADEALARLDRNGKILSKKSTVMRKDHNVAADAVGKMLQIFAMNSKFDGELKKNVRKLCEKHARSSDGASMQMFKSLCSLNEEALEIRAKARAEAENEKKKEKGSKKKK